MRSRHDRRWRCGADCAAGDTLAATALRETAALGALRAGVLLGGVRAGGVSRLTAGEAGLLAARAFGVGVESGFARAGAGVAALGVARARAGPAGAPAE